MISVSITQTVRNDSGSTLDNVTYNYTYDVLGNIVTISEGSTLKVKYYYDSLNQLTREDNAYLNKTITYSYDLGGNLTSVKEYAYQTGSTVFGTATTTNSYTYGDVGWKDKLTAYNGNTITYDAIGNPLSYYNGYSFTWTQGRRLATATNSSNTISYAYNSDGVRIKKTVNGTVTNYTLDGTKVIKETTGSDTVWYYYDESGTPVAFRLNNTLYLYEKNLQGDIIAIRNTAGTKLVSYVYNAWGKVTATNVAGTTEGTNLIAKNPYLYRGYRYDTETGLYYLNSRYYDPQTGRFINADVFVSTGLSVLCGNMFAYCLNNPANCVDMYGYASFACLDGELNPLGMGRDWTGAGGGGIAVAFSLALGVIGLSEANRKTEKKVYVPPKSAEKEATQSDTRNQGRLYSVYWMSAEGDKTKKIVYVGRVTMEGAKQREEYHKTKGRIKQGSYDNLSWEEARGMEQVLMIYYHSIMKGTPIYNQINGVSLTNRFYNRYWFQSINYLELLGNKMEEDILNALYP